MTEPRTQPPSLRPIARLSRLLARRGADRGAFDRFDGFDRPDATSRPVATGLRARGALRVLFALLALLAPVIFLSGRSASAALIATGNGTGNTAAPYPDPGFERVGVVNGLTGVYARNGWVLTAAHVGEGEFLLGGTRYAAVPGSTHPFLNDDSTPADLIAFKLATRPPLADVAIADTPAAVGTLLTVIGYGFDRGSATTWMGVDGWSWAATRSLRWGTNRISSAGELALGTQAFRITFDDLPGSPPGQYEADIVVGDSGGGAFVGSGASARLIGILFGHVTFVGQPASTSLFGNGGLIVDLYAYRDAILAVTDRRDCSDGLDDDGDGFVDFPDDPGCSDERDASERSVAHQCDNGLDDDGDLAIDFPNDDGCLYPTNPVEAPEPGLGATIATGAFALATSGGRKRRAVAQTSSTRSTR
ncbi:MAG: trypsin-like serine protease [Deltaproteobacteria bacterium]|nr:trypsin-like serine protease [Deltaproteobacteria bacterium]